MKSEKSEKSGIVFEDIFSMGFNRTNRKFGNCRDYRDVDIGIFQIMITTYIQTDEPEHSGASFARLEKQTNFSLLTGLLFWGTLSDLITIRLVIFYSGLGLIFVGIWIIMSGEKTVNK